MKVMIIEIKHYQLKNILIKLDHTKKISKMIFKKIDTWKIQLTIAINFMYVMHSKSDNIKIMINDKAYEVIEEVFQSLLCRCQIGLEKSMRGSDFIFDCVHLLYYECHRINFKCGGS